jgi:subtilase family serine protease
LHISVLHWSRRKASILLIVVALVLSLLPVISIITHAHAANNQAHSNPVTITFKGQRYVLLQSNVQPPTDKQCRVQFGFPCYSPQEMRRAYGLTPVLNAGFTGKGQTIVIIDSFGSPTIQGDLKIFDAGYGLPDPPSFKVLTPLGKIKFDPHNPDMVGWAAETTLDVEWAHAMAPGANIILMTSPVDETQGVQGMPEFLYLEQYALNHNLGKIISQSWGTTENTLFTIPGGRKVLQNFEAFYKQAAAMNVTVFASSGDGGVANPNVNGKIYPFPTVNFPASSPFVTAVGGTSLTADTHGDYQSEVAWSFSGGGVSQYFNEPSFQGNLPASDQVILNGFRGIPDIAYNADPGTPILIYLSFLGAKNAGFYTIGGTSEGSPQWAGIIADGNQWAGRPLGFINMALYQLGTGKNSAQFYHDITVGNNGQDNIPGYNATPGWDLVTGWGTPRAANLLQELIELTGILK